MCVWRREKIARGREREGGVRKKVRDCVCVYEGEGGKSFEEIKVKTNREGRKKKEVFVVVLLLSL